MWMWHNNEVPLAKATPVYEAAHSNVSIKPEVLSYADVHTKLYTTLSAGSGAPDICWVEGGQLAKFFFNGDKAGLVNLNGVYNAMELKAGFLEWAWKLCSDHTGAQLMGMPKAVTPGLIYYRRDMFDKAGLPSKPDDVAAKIRTWDDWVLAGTQIVKGGIAKYFHQNAADPFSLYQPGGMNYFTEDGNLKVGQDEWILKMVQLAQRIRQAKLDGKDLTGPAVETAWKNNQLAALMGGPWLVGATVKGWIPDTTGQWGAIPLPERASNNGFDALSIPQQGKNRDASFEFAKWYTTSKEAAQIQADVQDATLAYKQWWSIPELDKKDPYFAGQQVIRLSLDQAPKIPAQTSNPNDSVANQITTEAIRKVLEDNLDPKQALDDARKQILAKIGP